MALDFDFRGSIDALIEPWLGYNFIVFSTRDPVLTVAGIDSLELPTAQINYISQRGISTKTQQIPVSIEYTDLVLRSAVVRGNTVLSSKLDRMLDFFGGRTNFTQLAAAGLGFNNINAIDFVYDTISIVAFNGGAVIGKTPIGIWSCSNILPSGYSVETVDSLEAKLIHEEVRFKVNAFTRIL